MLASGMDYLQMFILLKDILGIAAYQDMIQHVIDGLQQGLSLYDVLKKETHLLPNDVVVLLKVGEKSANLQSSVENISKMYQDEIDVLMTRIVKVIEPIMLI